MKKGLVHTDILLSVSKDVDSDDETIGLLEAAYRFDVNAITGVIFKIIDNNGKEHDVSVHGWETDLGKMKFILA